MASTPSGADAPYKIQRDHGEWVVVNNAGLIKARFGQDRDKALAYQRALYVNVPGAAKRADKVEFTGKARTRVPTQKASHDMVFFEKRSTPLVVSRGAAPSSNSNYTEKYGKQTSRRAATAEEETKIAKGQWVQVDQSGKKGGEPGYKKTKYRPALVQKSAAEESAERIKAATLASIIKLLPDDGGPVVSDKPKIDDAGPVVSPKPELIDDGPGKDVAITTTAADDFLPDSPEPTDEVATEHDGAMIALFPDLNVASALAVPGGEKAHDLHVTIAFLDRGIEPEYIGKLASILAGAAHLIRPIEATLSGVGHFTAGDKPVTYVSVDAPSLPDARSRIVEAASQVTHIADDHGFTPHMTLAYGDESPDVPNLNVVFKDLWLVVGGKRWNFPLTGLAQDEDDTREAAAVRRRRHHFTPTPSLAGFYGPVPCAQCGRPSADPVHDTTSAPDAGMAAPAQMSSVQGIDDGKGTVALQPIEEGALSALDPSDVSPYLDENALIAANMGKPQAQMPHRTMLAAFTTPGGDDRCMTCGNVAPSSGICNMPPSKEEASQVNRLMALFMHDRVERVRVNERSPELPRVSSTPAVPESTKAFVTELNGHMLITGPASTLTDGFEKSMTPNKHMLWMAGNFVGAEKANRNGAFWSSKDLQLGEGTVKHGPLNWLHEGRHIIGTLADSMFVMPDTEQAAEGLLPRITASAAIWRWLYPDEAKVVEMASDQGKLWYSMECVSDMVECVGEGSCGKSVPYGDYIGGNGCTHMVQKSAERRFPDPTFLGGAVIVPPVRPGWADADATVMRQAASLAEAAYEQAGRPSELTASEFERIVAGAISFAS